MMDALLRWDEYRQGELVDFNEKSDHADCAGILPSFKEFTQRRKDAKGHSRKLLERILLVFSLRLCVFA